MVATAAAQGFWHPPKYIDPYLANVVLLTGASGATIVNKVGSNTITKFGDAAVSTTITKFGMPSVAQDGTGDYIETNSSTNFDLGNSNWTVDGWLYLNAVVNYGNVFTVGTANNAQAGTHGLYTRSGGTFDYLISGSGATGFQASGFNLGTATWNYFSMVRSGTTTTLYVNGVSRGSTTNVSSTTGAQKLYTYNSSGANYLNGNVILRVTKGVARPNVVPTQAFY